MRDGNRADAIGWKARGAITIVIARM